MYSRKTTRFQAALGSLFVLAIILFVPDVASAYEVDYYTYGGFSEVVSAFNKLALIQSSTGIRTLVSALWVATLAWGLIGVNYNNLTKIGREEGEVTTFRGSYASVIIGSFFGALLYVGTVLATGTLHIYDKTENQYQAVGGVPFIVVAGAGAVNMIERSIIELSETAGSPQGFSKQGGAKGFMVMNSLMLRSGAPPDNDVLLQTSLKNYAGDCVSFELSRTGTTLTLQELTNATDSFMTSFAKAVNPYVFTVVMEGTPGGVSMTCTDAWTNISARVAAASGGGANAYKESKQRACQDAGYQVFQPDTSKADAAYAACYTNTDALITSISPTWNMNKLIKESAMAYSMIVIATEMAPHLISDKNKASYAGSIVQEYMTTLASKRGQLVAVATAALPFVLMLVGTRMWPAAIKIALGFYLLPAIWGILMAIVSDFYMTSAVSAWTELLTTSTWGLSKYDMFSSSLVKEMNAWGLYLAGTFALALSISSKLGGMAALAGAGAKSAASASEGDIPLGRQGAGAKAKEAVITGEGGRLQSNKWIDENAISGAALSGELRNQYQSQSTEGTTTGQKKVLANGTVSEGAEAKEVSANVNSISSGRAIAAVGGMEAAARNKAFAESAVSFANGNRNAVMTAKQFADFAAANDVALKEVFGDGENYKAFLTSMHGKSAGEMTGAIAAYSATKEQIRKDIGGEKGDAAAAAYTWQGHHASRSEIEAGKQITDATALRETATALKMEPRQLQRIISNQIHSKAGNEAVAIGGGTDAKLSPEQRGQIYEDVKKVPMATPERATQAVQGMQQDISSGNYSEIAKDKAKAAAFKETTGLEAAKVAEMTNKEQQQQIGQQALQKLQAGTSGDKEVIARANTAALTALDKQEKQGIADIARENGVNAEQLQSRVDSLKGTPGPKAGDDFTKSLETISRDSAAVAVQTAVTAGLGGSHSGTAEEAKINKTNEMGGNEVVAAVTAQKVSKDITDQQAKIAANAEMFKKLNPTVATDNPVFFNKDGSLTSAAQDEMNRRSSGVEAGKYTTPQGTMTFNVDEKGKITNSEEKGTLEKGDKTAHDKKIKELTDMGNHGAAKALKAMDYEAADFRESRDGKNNLSTFSLKRGGDVEYKDVSLKDTSQTVNADKIDTAKTLKDTSQTVNADKVDSAKTVVNKSTLVDTSQTMTSLKQNLSGVVKQVSDVDEKVVARGTVFKSPQQYLQMLQNGDSGALSLVGDEKAHGQALDTSITHVSAQMAQAMAPIVKYSGENAIQASLEAAASVGVKVGLPMGPEAQMSAGMKAAGVSQEKWAYDQNQRISAAVLTKAREDATAAGKKGKDFTDFVAHRQQEFTNATINTAKTKYGFGPAKATETAIEMLSGDATRVKNGVGAAVQLGKQAGPAAFPVLSGKAIDVSGQVKTAIRGNAGLQPEGPYPGIK